MRTASLTTMTLLACGLAFAGRAENAVYTDGNLEGIAPQASLVLDLSGDKAIKIHAGRTDFSVPYTGVSKTGVAVAQPAKGQKSSTKSGKPAQMLTIEYKDAEGAARSMTLALSKLAASNVVAAIRKHSPVVRAAVKGKKTPSGKAKPGATDQAQAVAADTTVAQADATAKDDAKKVKPSKTAKKSKKDADKQEAKNDAASKSAGKDGAGKDQSWWGDSFWKTTRNQAKWDQQSGAAAQ